MKILVVEDNQKVARFLARAFAEEGYTVDQASDGAQALAQVGKIAYDLMILDWMLPTLDGLAVCRAARSHGVAVPILMLTARGEVAERILGLDAGADDYLTKPFDLGELLARARALIRRAGGDGRLRLGALTLEREERRALLEGKKLELTGKEFSLLLYLARNAGRAVTRMELLAKVWETSFDPDSNVIEVHVRNLRDKLGAHSGLIETVRGVGYRMVATE